MEAVDVQAQGSPMVKKKNDLSQPTSDVRLKNVSFGQDLPEQVGVGGHELHGTQHSEMGSGIPAGSPGFSEVHWRP